jgi:predicted NBD/HSP70 family sugar kinase
MLKKVNSSVIERVIYEKGPISKPELAKLTSLSLPTVSKLVDTLEKSAQLTQVGRTKKGVGRKAVLYETNRNSGCFFILYYTMGKYRCRITDMLSDILYETEVPLDGTDARSAELSTFKAIDLLMEHASVKVKAIGISLPGVVKPDGCLLGIPMIAAWEGFNLEKSIKTRYKVTVRVENIDKLLAVGYYSRVQGKYNNLVYMYMGNGIGAGLIINRQLYWGSSNSSGEIGFMASPVNQGAAQNYTLNGGFMETQLGKYLDYSSGNLRKKISPKQREEMINCICMIVVNHVAILNPELIVFGGAIFNEALLKDIKQKAAVYIPGGIMPVFVCDNPENTVMEGLILTCRSSVTTEMRLIRRNGNIAEEAI